MLFRSVSSMFYSDDTMHKINVDKGSFDLTYQLPIMIYSFLISTTIKVVINNLGLYDEDILIFKKSKNKNLLAQQKLLFRINFERPREIKNEDGVLISRHFRSLYINSKEYPKTKINSFSFDKRNFNRKFNFNDLKNKYKSHDGNFFSTEVKFNSYLNKTSKNINNLKNGNNLKELYFFNHNFSRTSFSTKTNNFLTNKSRNHNENTKTNNLNSTKNSKQRGKFQNKVSPLLFKSN